MQVCLAAAIELIALPQLKMTASCAGVQ